MTPFIFLLFFMSFLKLNIIFFCFSACPDGYHDNEWKNTWQCGNGATCNHVTGECSCPPGLLGENCIERKSFPWQPITLIRFSNRVISASIEFWTKLWKFNMKLNCFSGKYLPIKLFAKHFNSVNLAASRSKTVHSHLSLAAQTCRVGNHLICKKKDDNSVYQLSMRITW